jgi:hypothetical protein
MTKLIYRRSSADRPNFADISPGGTVNIGIPGTSIEVAQVGNWQTVTTTGSGATETAPLSATQILRWQFDTSGIPGSAADYGPNNNAAVRNTADSDGAILYTTHDASPAGTYGMASYVSSGSLVYYRAGAKSALLAGLGGAQMHIFISCYGMPFNTTSGGNGRMFEITSDTTGENTIRLERTSGNNLRLVAAGVEITQVRSAFTEGSWHLYEVMVDGPNIRLFKDGILLYSTTLTSAVAAPLKNKLIRVGNQATGGRLIYGYVSHVSVYSGVLSPQQLAWARSQAANNMGSRSMSLPALPGVEHDAKLRFFEYPKLSANGYSVVGTPVSASLGKALASGLNFPITYTDVFRMDGSPVTADGLYYTPMATGTLTYEVTADNGLHPPVTTSFTLPIVTYYAQLTAAEITTRLELPTSTVLITSADAGFPPTMTWRPSHVVDDGEGGMGLRVLPSLPGISRSHTGGEVQMVPVGHEGSNGFRLFRYDGWFKLTPGISGTVQTIFSYTTPYTAAHREFDFEFIGAPPNHPSPGSFSQSGRMDCAYHLRALDGSPYESASLQVNVPDAAFSSYHKWSIVANADTIEWLYDDTLMVRYRQGYGFDETVGQSLEPTIKATATRYNAAYVTANGAYKHLTDAEWHVNRQSFFAQMWCSPDYPGWLGPLNLPVDPPLFKVAQLNFTEFNPTSIAFQITDWSVIQVGVDAQITINAFRPANMRFQPTGLEYRKDGGAWTSLGGRNTGTYTVTGGGGGSYEIRAVAVSPGGDYTLTGNVSDTKVLTDLTAPILTSPTASGVGTSGYIGSVTTNEANGTLYHVLTTSATPPSAAQVVLGQNHTGAAAVAFGSQSITTTGVKNIGGSGLTASTTYYTYYVHKDGANNNSLVSSAASFTTAASTPSNQKSLAFGLTPLNDYSPEVPFLDIFKMSRPMFGSWDDTQGNAYLVANGHLDANGWPLSIPPIGYIRTIWDQGSTSSQYFLNTNWVLTYDGTGTVTMQGAVSNVVSTPGQVTFTITGNNWWVHITATNAAPNNVRNIRVIRADRVALYNTGERWNPDFINFLSGVGMVRFMDWQQTNGSPQVSWGDRPLTTDATYSKRGVPLETCIELCNKLGIDGWFCVPHQANDTYMTNMFTLIRDTLNVSLIAYLEYSNEVWNSIFSQYAYALAQGRAAWPGASGEGDFQVAVSWQGKRMTQMNGIAATVFSGAMSRIKRVAGVITTDGYPTEQLLTAPIWQTYEAGSYVLPSTRVEHVAVAAYWGGILEDSAKVSAILAAYPATSNTVINNYYTTVSLPDVRTRLLAVSVEAATHGLSLVMYEGGNHTQYANWPYSVSGTDKTNVQAAIRQHARTSLHADNMEWLFNVWRTEINSEGPFMHYGTVRVWDYNGLWSILEYYGQGETTTGTRLRTLADTYAPWWIGGGSMSGTWNDALTWNDADTWSE